jgi:hypothetical protein
MAWRRRTILRWLVGAVAGGAASTLAYQSVGYSSPAGDLAVLSAKEAAILVAVARRILRGTPLDEEGLAELVSWLDGYLGRQPAYLRREVSALLFGIEHGAPLFAGGVSRFTRRAGVGQDAVLAAWGASRFGLMRQGYAGLKGMVLMAGYRQPALLRSIGYDGPPFG